MLFDADADLVRRDPAVPGLGTLLDPEAFREALGARLPDARLGGARPLYVRYKPGSNCLVAYEIEVNGLRLRIYARAFGSDAPVKLSNALRGEVPGAFGFGRVLLDEHDAVVSFFPNDVELRALAKLAGEAERVRLVGRLVGTRSDPRYGALEMLAYKPERRYVARWRSAFGDGDAALKFYTRDGYAAARSSAVAFVSRGGLRVPGLLGASDRRHALGFEWLEGRPVRDSIEAPVPDLTAVESAGVSLAHLHAQEGTGLRPAAALAGELRAVADGIERLSPRAGARALRLAERLASALADHRFVPRPVHGDFHADQVLTGAKFGTAGIVDFDRAAIGDPAADLGTFAAHLRRDTLDGRIAAARAVEAMEALVWGYHVAGERPLPSGIGIHTAAALLRLAAEPFRRRQADWPSRIEALLDEADAAIEVEARGFAEGVAARVSGGLAR